LSRSFSRCPAFASGEVLLIFNGDLQIITAGHRKELEMKITSRLLNDIVIFDIDGEIKRSDITDITLHQLVKDQLDAGRRKILLNFEQVEFIDSFGVGEILASYISIHNLGGKLKLVRISKKLYLIFQVTGLTRVLDISEDEEAALKSFF
jgi:anti-sigma B factor antagonist